MSVVDVCLINCISLPSRSPPTNAAPFGTITPSGSERKKVSLFTCVCFPADNLVGSYFQAEAIHPDCAIISQHLRAREICSQTRRSEAQNQTDHSGGFARACVCVWVCEAFCFCKHANISRDKQETLAHWERILIDWNVGWTKKKEFWDGLGSERYNKTRFYAHRGTQCRLKLPLFAVWLDVFFFVLWYLRPCERQFAFNTEHTHTKKKKERKKICLV